MAPGQNKEREDFAWIKCTLIFVWLRLMRSLAGIIHLYIYFLIYLVAMLITNV